MLSLRPGTDKVQLKESIDRDLGCIVPVILNVSPRMPLKLGLTYSTNE